MFRTTSFSEYCAKIRELESKNIKILDKGSISKIEEEVNPIPFTRNYQRSVTEYYIVW